MGIALEEPMEGDILVEKNGHRFAVIPELKRLVSLYGDISVDFRESRWFRSGFELRIGAGSSCC